MYSAWFINDWLRIYDFTGNTVFRDVPELILTGRSRCYRVLESYSVWLAQGCKKRGLRVATKGRQRYDCKRQHMGIARLGICGGHISCMASRYTRAK
jgi:hypothetical protein